MRSRNVIAAEAAQSWHALFDQIAASLPSAAVRRTALDGFLATGFPTKRIEAWKYTDLSVLAEAHFAAPQTTAHPALHPLQGATPVVFVDGVCAQGAELTGSELPQPLDGVYALNTAFAATGLKLEVGRGVTLPQPVHVIACRSGARTATTSHLCHHIQLADNARADVILESMGDGEYLGTDTVHIQLGSGAQLRFFHIQASAAAATELANTQVEVGRDAHFEAYSVDVGLGLARHDFNIALCATGADADLKALSITDARAHTDTRVRIQHRAPHGRSRILFRGIAADHSRLVFDGLVRVDEGAVKTDSDQRLATLLLSSHAEANMKPELEIYNDDVRCDHGTATGQLDPLALFYLRSRGVDESAARELLTLAFVTRVLEAVPLPALRDVLRERVATSLRTALARAVSTRQAA